MRWRGADVCESSVEKRCVVTELFFVVKRVAPSARLSSSSAASVCIRDRLTSCTHTKGETVGTPPPPPSTKPTREVIPWGKSTFNLPYKTTSSAPPLKKRHFFFSTLNTIRTTTGSYENKIGALASRFETGEILLQESHGHLRAMYSNVTRTPTWSSNAILITNSKLMNDDGNQLTIPKATDAQSASKLVDCAFLRFDVTIHPSTAYSECTESSFTLKSAVGIPDIIRNNALSHARCPPTAGRQDSTCNDPRRHWVHSSRWNDKSLGSRLQMDGVHARCVDQTRP